MAMHQENEVGRGGRAGVFPDAHEGHAGGLGQQLTQLTREVSTLLRKEVELARTETSEKVSQALNATMALTVGGAVAFAGLLLLLAALVIGLAYVMPLWLSALLVGGTVAIIGGGMVAAGKEKLKAQNLMPERTIGTIKGDKQFVKEQLQ